MTDVNRDPNLRSVGNPCSAIAPDTSESKDDVSLNMSHIPRGGIYLGLRYGLGILVSFGNMLVMTRWIGPHAYGLFVTALGLTSFLAALTRGGIDTYLVRAENTPDKHSYDVASTLIAGLSLLLVAGGAAITPLLVLWYRSREFVPAYLVSLLAIPLAGLAGPATAKLERDLNFRAVASIELGGQLLALFVSATLAWLRLGVWAPVAGLLIWQAWAAGAAMRVARLSPPTRGQPCTGTSHAELWTRLQRVVARLATTNARQSTTGRTFRGRRRSCVRRSGDSDRRESRIHPISGWASGHCNALTRT